MKKFMAAIISFSAAATASGAPPKVYNSIATDCTEGSNEARVIPGQEVAFGASKTPYEKLTPDEIATFRERIMSILGPNARGMEKIGIQIFRSTMPNGDPIPSPNQWRSATAGPIALIRRDAGDCSWKDPISLGRDQGVSYGYFDVTCENSKGPFAEYWSSFWVGMQIQANKPVSACLHLGELANTVGATSRSSKKRG